MRKIILPILMFLLFTSHELFLKTDSYFLPENEQAELYLYNGTFDISENEISRDRIVKAMIIGPGYEFLPDSTAYYDRDSATYLKFKTGDQGTYVAGISTLPRELEMSGPDFTEYLEHEGLDAIMQEREMEGISGNTALEKYSKHVKAIFQVGDMTTESFSTELGYPIEFIPLKNPYELQTGDEMSFRLLYLGMPLINQTVHISFRNDDVAKEPAEDALKTNENGEFSFTLREAGQWYVAAIYMMESTEGNLDYESNWATLTFEIK